MYIIYTFYMNSQGIAQEQNTYMIQSMTAALRNLDYVSIEKQSPDYQEIYNKIKQFIDVNCVHKIIFDSVDTCCGENSIAIKYCIHCDKTFN